MRTPIKTLDLPVAGRGYSSQTLPLVFELIYISNSELDNKTDDEDGTSTIKHLINCRRIMNRITGTHASSLGLHPVVYFYNNNGRYNPTSFVGVIEFIKELEKRNKYVEFINIRRSLEDFILKNKIFQNQIIWKYGSGIKGYLPMKEYISLIYKSILSGNDEKGVLQKLLKEFDYLQYQEEEPFQKARTTFDTETKSEAFIREVLESLYAVQYARV